MATPNTSISALGLSDVNVELNYGANTARAFNDGIFRSLTGLGPRQEDQSPINISDLSNKTAFGGIISANSSNVVSYGVIEREISMLANTDMFECDVVWTANLQSGAAGTLTTNGKRASYKVTGVQEANVTSNVFVTATLSYKGYQIGTASKYISFTINSLPPMLFVNGNTVASSVAFEPTAASTSLTATANAPGSTIAFTVFPRDAGVLITGNTVSLSAQAGQAGIDNNRSYSILTELFFNNQIIAQDLKNVTVRAFYAVPEIIINAPATTNNTFANTGTVRSSLVVGGTHAVPGANLTWTATKVSGDDAVLTVAADRSSANLHVNVASGAFGNKKSIYDVTATLAYANGMFITSVATRLTLRTGAYGLSTTATPDVESGYSAQTAVSTVAATFQAGTLAWDIARISGDIAAVSNTTSSGSGTTTLTLAAEAVGTKTAVYRVNPVLSFDGVVMVNNAINVTTTAQMNAYTFSLTGASVNNQIGDAPVISKIITAAAHNIAGGTIVFSKSGSNSVLTTNSTAANVQFSTNTVGTDTYTLNCTLRDANGRTVEVKSIAQTLRAYAPNLSFVGANTLTRTGFSDQSASLSANAVLGNAGANGLTLSASLLVGSTLTVAASGNTTLQTGTLSTSRTTVGTNEGTYRWTATVDYFGQSYSKTWDATLSVTKDDAQFNISGSGQSLSSYNFPVVANGVINATHVIPGGTVTWARSGTGTVSNVPVQNNAQLVFSTQQSSVGTATASQNVTATLRDSAGAYVDQKSITIGTTATVNNPGLVLNGPASNTVSNTFHAEAQVITTPSVAAGLTGHTYQLNAVATSGSAQASSNSSAVLLRNVFDGAGEARGVYNVMCNVVLNGQVIASATKSVAVAAVCPAPTLNVSGNPSASGGSFNFPVNVWAWMDVSSNPPGATFQWDWNHVGGVGATNIYVEGGGSRLTLQNSQSNYGGQTSTYDFTCTFRTPNGTFLGSRTTRVSAYSERYNPNIALNYIGGTTSTVSGFDERLDSPVALQASVNPALGGHSYRINYAFVGGNFNQADFIAENNTGYMRATAYNIRSQNGLSQKTAQYDFYVDVVLNGQVISGAVSARTYHVLNPGAVNGVGDINIYNQVWNGTAQGTITFSPDGICYATDGNRTWMSPSNPAEAANFEVSFNGGSTWAPVTGNVGISNSVSGTPQRPNNRTYSGVYYIRNRWSLAVVGSGNWRMELGVGTPI